MRVIEAMGKYGISMTEAIEIVDSLGKTLCKLEQEEPITISLTPATVTHISDPSDYEEIAAARSNCRNCGAPYKGRVCEYCGTILP